MKHYNEGWGSRLFDVLNYIGMAFVCIVMLYPLMNTFAVSLSSPESIIQGKVGWVPTGFNLEGYKYIWREPGLWTAYRNTVVYAAVGTFIMLAVTSLMAYPLAIADFVLRRFVTVFLAITMFFGGGLIPTYLLIRSLHMMNTLWVMVLPGAVTAFNVIIFRSFFQSIPKELRESAYLDGAGEARILLQIYLPLSKALLATFALFGVVAAWNGWFDALVYLNEERKYPIQMLLRKLIMDADHSAVSAQAQQLMANKVLHSKNIKMATVIMTIFPILCMYPFLQKYFVTGMMVGSIKG